MPITLNCPKCKKPFRVRDESVGLRVKCPSCQAILQVPSAISPASMATADIPPSNPGAPPTPAGSRPPIPTAGDGGQPGVEEPSFFEEPRPHAGPPSLPPHPVPPSRSAPRGKAVVKDEDEDGDNAKPIPWPSAAPKTREKERAPRPEPARRSAAPSGGSGTDAEDWERVRGGLGWVRTGLFFALLPILAYFLRPAYVYASMIIDGMPEFNTQAKGLLSIDKLNLGDEIILVAMVLPLIFAYFFLLIGRLKLPAAPTESQSRGLATGSMFFTLLSALGAAGVAVTTFGPKFADLGLPKEVGPSCLAAWIGFGILAETFFVLFLAQAGFAVGTLKVLRETGMTIFLAVLVVAGAYVANQFYEFIRFEDLNALRADADKLQQFLIFCAVIAIGGFLIVYQLRAKAGIVKRAITRRLEEGSGGRD